MQLDTTLGDGCSIGILERLPEIVIKSISNTPLRGWPNGVVFEALGVALSLDED